MENDYLWDKTGEDKEIERLENALKSFRYQPTAPPELPAKIWQPEEKSKFSFFPKIFRLALVGFACLAISLVSFGLWLQFSNNKIEDIGEFSQPLVTPIYVEILSETDAPETTVTTVVDKKSIQPKRVSIQKPTNVVFRQTAPKSKQNKEVKLTKEERYAYNQLMLALSITGSKLKEVKDKANGGEETSAIIKSLK